MSHRSTKSVLPGSHFGNGMHPDPDKLNSVQECRPTPTNATTLQQFLGLASYYRRYIEKFADIATPVYNLTKANFSVSWTPECMIAIAEVKNRLTQAPVLAFTQFTTMLPHLYYK